MQCPFWHVLPPVQMCSPVAMFPQPPQFCASVLRLRQVPLQSVSPDGQTQTPPAQIFPPVQTLPQLPQFWASALMSRQVPPQHRQPGGHAAPQAPQLAGSLPSARQVPPQLVCAVGQQMLPGPPGEHCKPVAQPNSRRHSSMTSCRQRE